MDDNVNWADAWARSWTLLQQGNPYRNDPQNVFNTLLDLRDSPHSRYTDIEVDTCIVSDTRTWETGIKRDEENFQIVEQYADRQAAQAGHDRWVASLRDDPNQSIPAILLSDLYLGAERLRQERGTTSESGK